MSNQWKQIQINELDKGYGKASYAKIIDNEQGLQIDLVFDNSTQIQFLFETSVLSYNVCDEGRRLKTLDFLTNQYGPEFITGSPVYMVENSEYLNWFHMECYNIFSDHPIYHYVFLTLNDIVDVLTTYAPKIRFAN